MRVVKRHSVPLRSRGVLCVTATLGVLVPVAVTATQATATATAATPAVACTSQQAGLAAKLVKDITAAVQGRASTTAVLVNDRVTKTSCILRPDQKFDSASVVKVTVLATLLWDAQKTGR